MVVSLPGLDMSPGDLFVSNGVADILNGTKSQFAAFAFTAADTEFQVFKAGHPFLVMIAGVLVMFTDNKKSKWPFSRRSTVGVRLACSRCPAARCRCCALGLF